MTLEEYNACCAALPHARHVVQWGGAQVWKVAGKVFAIAGWSDGAGLAVTFKCSPMSFELLKTQPGLRPAPYLASRGLKWIQRQTGESLDDATLGRYISRSHAIVAEGLPRSVRRQLGLGQ